MSCRCTVGLRRNLVNLAQLELGKSKVQVRVALGDPPGEFAPRHRHLQPGGPEWGSAEGSACGCESDRRVVREWREVRSEGPRGVRSGLGLRGTDLGERCRRRARDLNFGRLAKIGPCGTKSRPSLSAELSHVEASEQPLSPDIGALQGDLWGKSVALSPCFGYNWGASSGERLF